jgi:betaine-homocysteine S-methyltransferase
LEYKGEALIALEVIKEFDLPAMVTMAPGDERSRDGYDWVEICVELEQNGAEVVGLNCLQGPQTMMPLLKQIRKEVTGYVAAQPVPHRTSDECKHFQYFKDKAGELVQPYNLDPYLLNRSEMAAFAREANELGINYIGICCGAGPHHVRAMAEALGRTVPASKYSPDMGRHKQLGNEEFVDEQHKGFVEKRG